MQRVPLVVLATCLASVTPVVGQAAAWRSCVESDPVECFILNAPGIPGPLRRDLLDAWHFAQRLLCTSTDPEDVRVGLWSEAGCESVGTSDVKNLLIP